MNPNTGHLVEGKLFEDLEKKFGNTIRYEPLPKVLQHAAKLKLAGREEAQVSLTSGGKLSKWAAKRRKARRRMQKESRRLNR